jgi:hypothetical protein
MKFCFRMKIMFPAVLGKLKNPPMQTKDGCNYLSRRVRPDNHTLFGGSAARHIAADP